MDRSATIQLGSYQFFERLGEGGSGQVYRALGPDGHVAVKILGPSADLDDAARARFGREIAALGQISHPGLVTLLDHGFDAELGPYLVLPLLPGANLRDLVAGQALCPEAAVLLIEPIAAAAAALHHGGYVHRDLKPENVIASPDGQVTVIDLGLAWRDGMTRHTDSGAAVGSVGYMAPEQIEGAAVGPAADVWALGVMLYEAIVGRRPFARPRPSEEAAAALIGACPRLTAADRRADDALAALVAECLAATPAARPSAEALAARLRGWIDWADGGDAEACRVERAAAIAAPVAYQTRIAPLRVRRLERAVDEALAAGRPFAALALCDRALAYAPERPELAALIARVESAMASAAPVAPAASVAATAPVPPRSSRGLVIAGAAILAVLIATAIVLLAIRPHPSGSASESSPGPGPFVEVTREGDTEQGLDLAKGLLSLVGRAMTVEERRAEAGLPPRGSLPTTAAGWLERAGAEPPAAALGSIRQALALQPTWLAARERLCEVLATLGDPAAAAACADVARAHPDDPHWAALRDGAPANAGE